MTCHREATLQGASGTCLGALSNSSTPDCTDTQQYDTQQAARVEPDLVLLGVTPRCRMHLGVDRSGIR